MFARFVCAIAFARGPPKFGVVVKVWLNTFGLWERHTEYSDESPWPPFPAHSHMDYQFLLSDDAPSAIRLKSGLMHAPAGALSVVHPLEVHAAVDSPVTEGRTVTWRMLNLRPAALHEAAASLNLDVQSPVSFLSNVLAGEKIARLFREWHVAAENGETTPHLNSLGNTFFEELILRHRRAETPPEAHWGRLRPALQHLAENLEKNITLQELTRLTRLNRHQLHRAFVDVTGMSPHRYLVRLRVDAARRLLAAGCPLTEVAHTVGFSDQSHFTRHFKLGMKNTPGRYSFSARKKGARKK